MRSRPQETDPFDMTVAGDLIATGNEDQQPGQNTPAGEDEPQRRLTAYERRQQPPSGRHHGPDTIPGLAAYFEARAPLPDYGRGLYVSNFKALMATFSDLRRQGVTPATCRAMVDLYFQRLGTNSPRIAPCWDFKGRRHDLLNTLNRTGATATADDYATWHAPATDAGQDFAASWGLT